MKTTKNTAQQHLASQREFVKSRHLESQRAFAARSEGGSGLVDDTMLAASMRSVRYNTEAHAAGDVIDNAIEAGATQVHVVLRTDGGSEIKEIAFIDDGAGIDETFLPHATKWGGSSNEGKRNIFGRFGFGLPSASVNRGTRYAVISRTEAGAAFKQVAVDLKNLGAVNGVVPLPQVKEVVLPDWVADYVASTRTIETKDGPRDVLAFAGGEAAVRTVVVWSDFDRLLWPNKQQAAARLMEHLGITYAGWLETVKLYVDAAPVDPVDVLFTTPGYRYYDVGEAPRAEPKDSVRFEVADVDGVKHPVTVRFSLLPVAAYNAEHRTGGRGRPARVRQRIRTDYNGIFVTRNGRFIELARPALITWSNYARPIGVALDFPPELDEFFGVTPDKQTITFSEKVEATLKSHGVKRAFDELMRVVEEERSRLKRERDAEAETGVRPSEETIAKVVELDNRRTRKVTDEAQQEAQANFRRRVKEIADQTGLPEEDVQAAQEQQQERRPYKVEFARLAEDDPFYTPQMDGTQLVLRINTTHSWYREVYNRVGPDQAQLRSALELMLWVLAMAEIDSTGETKIFYRAERREWSRLLAAAYDIHPLVYNKAASLEEIAEADNAAWLETDGDDDGAEAEA